MALRMSVWDLGSALKRKARAPSWQLFFVCLGFLFGIGLASWVVVPIESLMLLVIASSLVLSACLTPRREFVLLFCVICAAALGIFRYQLPQNETAPSVTEWIGEQTRVSGLVVQDPSDSDAFQKVVLDALVIEETEVAHRLIAWVPRYPELAYGDRISVRCKFEAAETIEGFAYDRYLAKDDILATCITYDQPYVEASDQGSSIRSTIYHLRSTIELGLERALSEPHATLARGLLLGQDELSDAWSERFRRVGLSHIVAASGYNVTVFLSVIFAGVIWFLPRKRAFVFVLAAIVLYVLLAGAEAPVIRAGLMAAVALFGRHLGRHAVPRNLLLVAAVVMLAFNPFLLRDDIGFQLSLLATAGILFFSKRMSERFAFIPETFGLREAWSTSLAATFSTLPLTVFQFGTLSLVSPIANLLVLPLIPFTMALAALAGFLALIFPFGAPWFGAPAWALEELIFFVVRSLAELPFASILL